ncbi:hypothetical protein [Kaarinaea lacus]
MKTCSYLLILLLILLSSQAHAGAVEKCTDSSGKITYTDKGCKGKETSQDAYFLGTNKKARYKKSDKSTVHSFKVSEIGALTEQAIDECTKQAGKYFADSRPDIVKNSETEFQTIKDRSLRGEKVEIILSGVMRTKSDNDAQELKIQCTASRSRETDWVLVYQDTASSKN